MNALMTIAFVLLFLTGLVYAGTGMTRRMRHRRLERLAGFYDRYRSVIASVLEGHFLKEGDALRQKPDTPAWQAIENLLLEGMDSPSEGHRQQAARMFEELGYVDFYLDELSRKRSQRRILACLRLSQMKSPRAIPYLIHLLDDSDETVYQEAVRALGIMGDPRVVSPLVKQVGHWMERTDPASRQALKESLVACGEQIAPVILPYLSSPEVPVRGLAVELLGEIRSQSAMISLIRIQNDPSPEVRVRVAEALGRIDHPLAFEPLTAMLLDTAWAARFQAVQSLTRMKSLRSIHPLCLCLEDECWKVQVAVVEGLAHMGQEALQALTLYLLYGPDHSFGERVAELLYQSGLVDRWIHELEREKNEELERLKRLLSAIAANRILRPFIMNIRTHPDKRVRICLLEIVANLDKPYLWGVFRQVSEEDCAPEVRSRAEALLEAKVSAVDA